MWTLREEREHRHFVWLVPMFADMHDKGSFDFSLNWSLSLAASYPSPSFPPSLHSSFRDVFPATSCSILLSPVGTHSLRVLSDIVPPSLCVWNSGSFGSVLSEGEAVFRVVSLEKTILFLWITFPKYQNFKLNIVILLMLFILFWRSLVLTSEHSSDCLFQRTEADGRIFFELFWTLILFHVCWGTSLRYHLW